MHYRLEDLLDIPRLQSLLDSFSAVSGVPTCIVSRDGALLSCAGWKDICLGYHRRHPESLRCCEDSNTRVVEELSRIGGKKLYTCPHGFMKAAFALAVDGEYLGTMFTGQLLQEEPDLEQFRAQARRYGFDEEAYLGELRRVPVMGRERLDAVLDCLSQLTQTIVDMALTAKGVQARSAEIQRLAEQYSRMLDTTTDGFWTVDAQGRCLEANAACSAINGYSREELLGMTLSDLEAVESPEETLAHIAMVKRDGFGRFETRHRRKDGTLVDLEISTSYIASEDVFVAFLRDITERNRFARDLQERENRLRVIFDASQSGMFLVNPQGNVSMANRRMAELFACPLDEIIGLHYPELAHADEREFAHGRMQEMLSGKIEMVLTERHYQKRQGGDFWGLVSVRRHLDPEGNLIALVGTLTDITEQKQASKALQVSERRFRSLFDAMQEGVVLHELILDEGGTPADYRILNVNPAFTAITGIDQREAVGALGSELYGTGTPPYLHEFTQPLFTGHPFSFETYFPPMDKHFQISVFSPGENQFATVFFDISDRKLAERGLQDSFLRTQEIVQSIPSGLYIYQYEEPDRLVLLEGNEAARRLTGLDYRNHIGTEFNELWPEARSVGILDAYLRVMQTGKPYQTEDLYYKDDRLEGAFSVRAFRMSGNRLGVAFENITERKQAEQVLIYSEKRFRNLFELAPVPYQSIDGNGTLLEVNEAWCTMMGYERSEVLGSSMNQYLADYARPLLLERLSRLVREGSMSGVACQLLRKDGSPVDVVVEGSVGRDSQGRFKQTHCILFDVTERKRAEERLLQSQQRLQFLVSATPTVIYTCRPTGDFGATFVSDNVRRLMGYEPKDFLEDPAFWLDHLHAEDRPRVVADLAEFFTAGCHSHEYRFRTKDGAYRWMHDEIVLVRDADGTPLECIGCWLDVTERHEVEQEVRRLNEQLEQRVVERTSELESFCYSISHDLRAPLRAIDGFTAILREEYEPRFDEMGKDLCDRIGSNAVRMGALIDDLLAFSRVGRSSLEPERLDMALLCRSAFEELLVLEDRSRIEFRLESLPDAEADRATMGQVWANLLGNALKYSSREPRALIEVGGRREGGENVYFVRDNGVGFDMAYVDKLFGVFLRVHSPVEFPGTGVGLAIVERIVQRHGGRVWAEGEVGKGATFFFALPVRAQLQ